MQIIKQLEIGKTFPINEDLAGLVPLALKAEQEALAEDIACNGLTVPITLWRGECVDGRCRMLACIASNVAIKAIDLEDRLTFEEVAVYVKSINTRRNLTIGQKIVSASKSYRSSGNTIGVRGIAKSWGISTAILTKANYICKHRPEFIEPLFNGGTVSIINKEGYPVDTNKISAIHASIKREEDNVVMKDVDYGWKVEEHINTQVGLDFFYATIIGEKGIKDIEILKYVALGINTIYTTECTTAA